MTICKHNECSKRASFGFDKVIYCKEHSEEGMNDIRSKKCIHDNCNKQSHFALCGNKAIYCKDHATLEMINVTNKCCIYAYCMKQPTFAMFGQKAIYCNKHALVGMVDVKHEKCLQNNCNKRPTFALPNNTAIYCKEHALETMIDVKNKLCVTCNATRVNPKFKPNCARCHYYLKPDDPRIRNYKTREQAFMIPLQEKYPEMVLDKVISGGCSKRRPDGLLDCLTHIVIVEIDEDQHVGYDKTCDNRRTMEIFTDLGNRPIVFIRMNPDAYMRDGKRIGKVFSISKTGELKRNNKEFTKRFEVLVNAVTIAIDSIPTCEVSYNQLFFNDE